MTEDPVRTIQAALQDIQKHGHGWTAKLGGGGTWTISGPGGQVRLADPTDPVKAASALARLDRLGFTKTWAKMKPAAVDKRPQMKPPKPSTAPFQAPDKAPKTGSRAPAYPGEPSPDEGPVRRKTLLTPALARELLSRPWSAVTSDGIALRQRDLESSTVQFFADLINRDRFKMTYQGCGIGENGSFYDGQHRAHAVISTGKSVWVWMNYNVQPDDIDGLDGGRQRRTSTRLSMEGFDHPLLVGSSAKLLCYYLDWEAMPDEAPAWARWYSIRVSDPVLRELVHAEPDLYKAVRWVSALKQPRGPGLNLTAASVFRYLVLRDWPDGKEALDAFLLAVVTGVGIHSSKDEAMHVRDWLARNASKPALSKYCHVEAHLVLMITAWNRHIKEQSARRIPGALWPKFPTLYTPGE